MCSTVSLAACYAIPDSIRQYDQDGQAQFITFYNSFISWDPFVDRLEDPNLLRNAFPVKVLELDLLLTGS